MNMKNESAILYIDLVLFHTNRLCYELFKRINSMQVIPQKIIRVLIVDDRPPARAGLKALISSYKKDTGNELPIIEVIAEADCGDEAIHLVDVMQPDVVIMDVRMPGIDGIETTRIIKEKWPEIRVVILTMYAAHRIDALKAGADEFLIKGCPPEELFEKIISH